MQARATVIWQTRSSPLLEESFPGWAILSRHRRGRLEHESVFMPDVP
jgi:hypothetical protein